MDAGKIKEGSVVVLKERYTESGLVGIVIEIQESMLPGKSGWISMNYVVMMSTGNILNISESCVKSVIE